MNKEQEQAFWDTIRVLHDIDILSHVMLIGSLSPLSRLGLLGGMVREMGFGGNYEKNR